MAIPSIQAGKIICELSGWDTSTLRLQKLLYIAHMFYAGEQRKRLINEDFEAWKRGPVEPNLYRYCRGYGADPIPDIFPIDDIDESRRECQYLKHVVENTQGRVLGTKRIPLGALLNYTHWEKGAWKAAYDEELDKWYRDTPIISFESIVKEYDDRKAEGQFGN